MDLISRLKKLVKEKHNKLGIREYRSVSQAAEDAIEKFLLEERKPVVVPA